MLTTSLLQIKRPKECKVIDILDDHCVLLDVFKDDESLLACVNKWRTPHIAFPTFVTYPSFFAF